MNQLRVAVIGADQVIGRAIVRALASIDWAITQVVERGDLEAAVSSADAVINATLGDPKLIAHHAQALHAALKNTSHQPRVVHFSSMTVYGQFSGKVTESQPMSDDLGEYSKSQIFAERLISQLTNTVILRPGCEYGPECIPWSERIGKWLLTRRVGDMGVHGDGICNLVYIDDVVAAALRAVRAENIGGSIFNLAMPSPPTWNEYLIQYAKALGAVPVRRVTRRRLKIETKVLAIPLKIAELLAQRAGLRASPLPLAIPPSFIRLCEQEVQLDATSVESKLAMQWTQLAEGLSKTAQWLLR
jgi:2-alkyl-3-oxoalkanoate reductase